MAGYKLIRPDEALNTAFPKPRVYLGGQCKGRDWRLDTYQRFEREVITFVSPRRETFADPEMDPTGHARQVGWERSALDYCQLGVFWLGEGLGNQAARVEIGYMLGAQKPVLLGAEKGFLGIEHLVGFSGLVVAGSLDGLMNRLGSMLEGMKTGG